MILGLGLLVGCLSTLGAPIAHPCHPMGSIMELNASRALIDHSAAAPLHLAGCLVPKWKWVVSCASEVHRYHAITSYIPAHVLSFTWQQANSSTDCKISTATQGLQLLCHQQPVCQISLCTNFAQTPPLEASWSPRQSETIKQGSAIPSPDPMSLPKSSSQPIQSIPRYSEETRCF